MATCVLRRFPFLARGLDGSERVDFQRRKTRIPLSTCFGRRMYVHAFFLEGGRKEGNMHRIFGRESKNIQKIFREYSIENVAGHKTIFGFPSMFWSIPRGGRRASRGIHSHATRSVARHSVTHVTVHRLYDRNTVFIYNSTSVQERSS